MTGSLRINPFIHLFSAGKSGGEVTAVVGSVAALLQLCCSMPSMRSYCDTPTVALCCSSVAALLQYADELLGGDSGSRLCCSSVAALLQLCCSMPRKGRGASARAFRLKSPLRLLGAGARGVTGGMGGGFLCLDADVC